MTSSTPRLGFFTQLQGRSDQDFRELYAQFLDTVVAAEELGYDSVWLGQHHFATGGGRASAPWPLLAAAAARTSRIELGTAVSVLPFEDPIRLAEDVATVYEISGGRVNLGVGSGGGDRESFEAFGVHQDDRRAVFDRKLAVLTATLGGGEVSPGRTLAPSAPGLRQRLWQSAGTTARAAAVAESGDGLLIGTFSDHPRLVQRAKVDAYVRQWRLSQPDRSPRIAALRFTYVGESKTRIEREVADGLTVFRREFADAYEPSLAGLTATEYLDRVTRYGTVDDVIAAYDADPALTPDVTDLVPNLSLFPGAGATTSGEDLSIRRLRVFAEEIFPRLRLSSPSLV